LITAYIQITSLSALSGFGLCGLLRNSTL